jgi:hypothetical protein
VLATVKATGGNPEALATSLLQTANADVLDADPDCATKTGYEHCQHCAMPAIGRLVGHLVKVTDTIWKAQQALAANANTACDKGYPTDRAGGAAKCCSAATTTSAGSYQPAGFNECTAGSTFSPNDAVAATAANIRYSNLKGVYYDVGTPSSMVTDCCRTSSACVTNDAKIKESIDTTQHLLNTLHADRAAKTQKIDSVTIELSLETRKIAQFRSEITKICELAADTDTDTHGTTTIAWPTDSAEAITQCTVAGSQVNSIVVEESVRQTKLQGDANSFGQTIAVIERVIEWLNTENTGIFKDNLHAVAPNVVTATTHAPGTTVAPSHTHGSADDSGLPDHYTVMVNLLEGAAKSTANSQASQALTKAAQLLESSASAVRGAAEVIRLLKQILGDMQSSKAKIETYKITSKTEAHSQITNLVAQIASLKDERAVAMLHEARLLDSKAGYSTDVSSKTSEIAEAKAAWALKYNQRALNSKKCIAYMSFYDAETQTNTEELLILKKTIEIIKHITCTATVAPTAFPTSFPTISPTELTNSPTAYPTRAPTEIPTATPTATPTAQPTTARACVAGDYYFMSKVFANPERFAVPAYTNGVKYTLAAMTGGDCKTAETSHTNVDGAVQTISHQYQCCGQSGTIYGAIAQSDDPTAADLCADSGNADHCGLFGANMYTGATDPSGTVTSGETTAPTAAPTSYPTRAPSNAPTAYPTRAPTVIPTAYPTETPTGYPTALAHADDSLQISTNNTGFDFSVYNITVASFTGAPTPEPGACKRGEFRNTTVQSGEQCQLCTTCDQTTSYYAKECQAGVETADVTICVPLKVCTANKYQSVPKTKTTDRICTALKMCSDSEFESTTATATADRVCTQTTACTTTQFVSAVPTSSSDRVCTSITACAADQFESALPTSTADRQCTALMVCSAQQYETQGPSLVTDRTCTALTVCGQGQCETAAATSTSDRMCQTVVTSATCVAVPGSCHCRPTMMMDIG